MNKITDQCTCGILFDAPMASDDDFMTHVTNGTHASCLLLEVCGPCFMGFCKECEKVRRSDVQKWKCRCMHDYPLTFNESVVSVEHMREVWSEWLFNGRNSSVKAGIEEVPPTDGWHPIKEI